MSDLSQLLSSVGDSRNDQMMRMLIGLIILMAVLQELQGDQQGGGQRANGANLLDSLGGGNYSTMTYTSTSITVEQSSVAAAYNADAGGGQASGGQAGGTQQGGQIDISI